VRGVQPDVLLGLAHYGVGREAVLSDLATDRTGEDSGLQRRDADLAIELGAPRLVVCFDQEPQVAPADLVACCAALGAAPLCQVVRNPAKLVQHVSIERILELDLVAHLAQECRPMPSTRYADSAGAASQPPRARLPCTRVEEVQRDKPSPIASIRPGASAAQSTLPKMMTSFSVSQ
jgi:hypothetical protein